MGEQHVPLYTSAYAGYDVRTRIRSLTYGDDVGQSGWLTADELERFARSLELDSGSRLLDVGCGAGGPALRLASTTGATVVGVDVLDEAVATARQLADEHGLADRATFVRADADRRLPFDEGSFDAILSVDAMCHLPERLAVLREWRRLASPGARILFTDPTVVTGLVTAEEIKSRSLIGIYVFSAPAANEASIAGAGFRLIDCDDVRRRAAIPADESPARRRAAPVPLRVPRDELGGLAPLPHPQRHEARDHRDEEDLAQESLEHRKRLGETDGRRQVAEAEGGEGDEAEVEVLALFVWPRLHEERPFAELVYGQVEEREQEPDQHVRTERPEHGLVGHTLMTQDAADRHRQRGRHEQGDRKQVREADELRRVDEEHDRRERDCCNDRHGLPTVDRGSGLGIADRDEERDRREDRAADRPPTGVVQELQQEEVREQQHQQARVAVEHADDVAPGDRPPAPRTCGRHGATIRRGGGRRITDALPRPIAS